MCGELGDGAPDSGLGGAIFVEELRVREALEMRGGEIGRAVFSGDDDGFERAQIAAGFQKQRVQRRQAEGVRDALFFDDRSDGGWVALFT